MQKTIHKYYCDVCHVEITNYVIYTNVHLGFAHSGVPFGIKEWHHLCEEHYLKIKDAVASIITTYPVNNKLEE